jgi:hypothetical protein
VARVMVRADDRWSAVLAALRSHMGDAAFQEAQAWGRSAGTKYAVEFALEQA